MTPQQKAIAEILQVSLFKLAEEYHAGIARLRAKGMSSEKELNELTNMVESMIDEVLEEHVKNGNDFSIAAVERIHEEMSRVRRLAQ